MKLDNRMHTTIILSNSLWDYFIVYLLLLLSAGFFFRQQFNRFTVPLYLFLLIFTIVHRGIELRVDALIPTITMIALMMLTAVLTGFGGFERYIFFAISTLTAYFITQLYTYRELHKLFSNILYYICIASIIGWFLVEFAPSLVMRLPRLVNSYGYDAAYLGLTMLNVPSYVGFTNRAMGIFWEPGAFQTMIVIALIGDLFVNNNSNSIAKKSMIKRYFVYFLALILTMSTTGYICACILVAIIIVKDRELSIFQMVLLLSAITGIILLFQFKDKLPSFLYFTLFGKLDALLEYKPGAIIGDLAAQKTAYVRMDSIYYPFIEFLKSPLWGIGFSGYNRISETIGYSNMATFTPINYFAYFGIFYAFVSIKGYLNTIKKINAGKLCKVLIFILLIIAVSSEDFCGGTACITIFILYGYDKRSCIDERIID